MVKESKTLKRESTYSKRWQESVDLEAQGAESQLRYKDLPYPPPAEFCANNWEICDGTEQDQLLFVVKSEPFAKGGFGYVYEGWNPYWGTRVAVKTLSVELQRDRAEIEAFRTEAMTQANLSHPHIGTVIGYYETIYGPALVQRFYDSGEDTRLGDDEKARFSATLQRIRSTQFHNESARNMAILEVIETALHSGATVGDVREIVFEIFPDFYHISLEVYPSLFTMVDKMKDFPIAELVQIFSETALAIEYAASQGILYADLQPKNILVGSQTTKVIDFGVMQFIHSAGANGENAQPVPDWVQRLAGEKRHFNSPRGTFAFVSPEQVLQPQHPEIVLDVRSSVFSLGIMAALIIFGQAPFGLTEQQKKMFLTDADPASRAARAQVDVLVNIVKQNPQLRFSDQSKKAFYLRKRLKANGVQVERLADDELIPNTQKVLAKALEKDRENRYATPTEFVLALEAAAVADGLLERSRAASEKML